MSPERTHTSTPPMRAEEIPPGVQEVILPNGERALAYSTGPTNPPPPAVPSAPVAQPIPAWAKSTALLAPTVGGGIAVAAVGLSAAAPGLVAVSHVLWSAVAAIATGGSRRGRPHRPCPRPHHRSPTAPRHPAHHRERHVRPRQRNHQPPLNAEGGPLSRQ